MKQQKTFIDDAIDELLDIYRQTAFVVDIMGGHDERIVLDSERQNLCSFIENIGHQICCQATALRNDKEESCWYRADVHQIAEVVEGIKGLDDSDLESKQGQLDEIRQEFEPVLLKASEINLAIINLYEEIKQKRALAEASAQSKAHEKEDLKIIAQQG